MSKTTSLNEREFELINIIGKGLNPNQRDLSNKMDLSLGMVNMLIRRMISKGYIRIEQLNKRKFQYLLTPKGFAEKLQKSIKYTRNTIDSISQIKTSSVTVIKYWYRYGYRKFYLFSGEDIAFIVHRAFDELALDQAEFFILDVLPQDKIDGLLIIAKENIEIPLLNQSNTIDLVTEISKDSQMMEMVK